MIMFHRFTSIRKREDIWNGNSYYRQSEAESPDPAAGRMAIRIWEVNLKKIITELSEALLSAVCRIRRRCSHWTRAILYGQGWHTLWKYLRLPGRWDRILRKIFCYIKRMRDSNRTMKEDICNILQCAGLIHDIGNPPFGHYGEVAIREWVWKKSFKDRISRTPGRSASEWTDACRSVSFWRKCAGTQTGNEITLSDGWAWRTWHMRYWIQL